MNIPPMLKGSKEFGNSNMMGYLCMVEEPKNE